jgi:hypothetical protein
VFASGLDFPSVVEQPRVREHKPLGGLDVDSPDKAASPILVCGYQFAITRLGPPEPSSHGIRPT